MGIEPSTLILGQANETKRMKYDEEIMPKQVEDIREDLKIKHL